MPRATTEPVAPAAAQTTATSGNPTSRRTRLVARFDEAVIIRSASQPSGAVPPSRRQTAGSLSWLSRQRNRRPPGAAEAKSFVTAIGVPSSSRPASTPRCSPASTATFMVLAA